MCCTCKYDLHIHMILDGVYYRTAIDAQKETPDDTLIRTRLEDYRTRGVRFLRDGGDAWGVNLRARALAGEYGIDYRSPAFPIHKSGHYGGFIGRSFADFDGFLRLLDEVHTVHGDFVKLMISGLIDFSRPQTLTEPGLDPDEIARLIGTAHSAGFAVMAHANGDETVRAAIDAGVDSIEHGAFLSEATLREMGRRHILWVPTLSTIGNLIGSGRFPDTVLSSLLAVQQQKLRFAADCGAYIGLGTDAGAYRVLHGQAVRQEYDYLHAALGESTDALLSEAAEYARTRFRTSF